MIQMYAFIYFSGSSGYVGHKKPDLGATKLKKILKAETILNPF